MGYKYLPIQPGQIRLLNLEIGNSDEIHVKLLNVSLDSVPPYEALSYRWLDNRVTETLWADAICINQNDAFEKKDQINRMDQIYCKALRVVTYIGEGDGDTESAIALAGKMLQLAATSEPATDDNKDQRFKEQCACLGIAWTTGAVSNGDHQHPGVRELQRMLDASWSRRVWIIQESLLNSNMLMMCGRFEMPWTMLYDLAGFMFQRRLPHVIRYSQTLSPDPTGGSAWAVRRIGSMRLNFNRMTALDIIQGANQMLCSEPRDKVYGLLGVFRFKNKSRYAEAHDQQYDIEVDYQKPVAEVYTDAARFFLSETSDLRLFASICMEPNVAGLPSWVPDWTHQTEILQLSAQPGYMAAGRTHRLLKIDDTANRITISGACIDRLSYVSDELLTAAFDARAPHQSCLWLAEQVERVQRSNKYPNAIDALWRTFTANTSGINRAADSARALGHILSSLNTICRQCSAKECITIPGIEARANPSDQLGRFLKSSPERSFCMTETGYCGLIPTRSRIGDFIAIVRGGRVPLVFRERGDKTLLVGEGYVHGLMDGEAIDGDNFRSPYQEIEFVVV